MKLLLFFFMIGIAGFSFAQTKVLYKIPQKGSSIQSFVPEGYDTLMIASGDLNKDKTEDVVMILEHEIEKQGDVENSNVDSIPSRLLVILFRKGNAFQLAGISDSAVMCKHCGGIMGDPFQTVSIEKGIMVIDHYGGSAWRWGYTHKFRYQKDAFFLIGQRSISYWNVEMCEKLGEFAATEYEDINFVTGGYEMKKVSQEGCKLLVNKKGKRPIRTLVNLNKFSVGN